MRWRPILLVLLTIGLSVTGLVGTLVPAHSRTSWTDPSPHELRQVGVAPGVQLEVLDWGGRGTPLVFLAGYGNSAHVFDGFAPRFRDTHHVFGITRRGFGGSTLARDGYNNATLVHDVIAAIDALGLTRPTFVAHSFGGSELNGIAASYPGRARGLIYLDAGFDFADLYSDPSWVNTPIPRPPVSSSSDGTLASEVAYVAEQLGPGYPEAELRISAGWSEATTHVPSFHADSLATWLMAGTPHAPLRDFHVPVLAIYGVPSTVVEKYPWYERLLPKERKLADARFAVETPLLARERQRFRDEVPQSRIIEVAGGRHYVFLTNPAEVSRAIRAFAP